MLIAADFFAAFFAALALENILFTRGLDFPGAYQVMSSPKRIFQLGGVMTGVMAVSAVPIYFLNLLIKPLGNYRYYGALCYIMINAAAYVGAYFLIKKCFPRFFEQFKGLLPYASLNCITFGAILISARMSEYNVFIKFFGYNIGAGIGFTLAMLVLWSIHQRLCYSEVPKAFQGLPVMLITIGIISLSIFGLAGSQLPA